MPPSKIHKKKRSKNWAVLAIILGICALIWAVTMVKIDRANASSDLESCPAASNYDLSTDPETKLCDIYSRQLQYRENAVGFRDQLHERAQKFAAPRQAAYQAYRQELEAMHESIDNDTTPSLMPVFGEE